MMTIARFMTRDPVTVTADQPVRSLARTFKRDRYRHLPVVGKDCTLVGIVDDAEVFRHGLFTRERGWESYSPNDREPTAADLANPALITRPTEPVRYVLEALIRSSSDAVVVVDTGQIPVGIFTEHDAVGLAADTLGPDLPAADWGTSPVMTLSPTATAREVLETMAFWSTRHVVVADANGLHGVLSWRDLLEHDAHAHPNLQVKTISPGGALETAQADEPLRAVAERMFRQSVGCLPVVDARGDLAAVVTRTDLIVALLRAAAPV